jgi:LysM repeat protein
MKKLFLFLCIFYSCSSDDSGNDLADGLSGLEMIDNNNSLSDSKTNALIDTALADNSTTVIPDSPDQQLDLSFLDGGSTQMITENGTISDVSSLDLPMQSNSSTESTMSMQSTSKINLMTSSDSDEPSLPTIAEESSMPSMSEDQTSFQTYVVKSGDTLMKIAFELYTDIGKWQDLADWNNIASGSLTPGMNLKYKMYVEKYQWNPTGTAYLILHGDTLGKISNSVYGTSARYLDIFNNNRPLIKNPNRIYAGFTLYYKP